MREALLTPLYLALGSCTLLFGNVATEPLEEDAAVERKDGGVALECARRTLIADSFGEPGAADFEIALRGGATMEEIGGRLVVGFEAAEDQGLYLSNDTFDLDFAELTADIGASSNGGSYGVVKLLSVAAEPTIYSIEAGQLPDAFGWQSDTVNGTQTVLVADGAAGLWRLRRSGDQVLIESSAASGMFFEEVGRLAVDSSLDSYRIALEGRQEAVGSGLLSFGSLELSGPPDDRWCTIDSFDYAPNQGRLEQLFSIQLSGDGEVAETPGGVLTLRAAEDSAASARLQSIARYDLNQGALIVRLDDAVVMPAGNAVIELQRSSEERFGFWLTGFQLRAYAVAGGELRFAYVIYDRAIHKFLRVAMLQPGELSFETSTDSTNWQPMLPLNSEELLPLPYPAPFPLDALELNMRVNGVTTDEVRLEVSRLSGQAQ